MADIPRLDWFSKVTNVHFAGGDWLYAFVDTSVGSLHLIDASLDLIDIAGGTPGFQFYPNIYPDWPHTVSKSELAKKTLSGAGTKFTVIGAQRIGAFEDLNFLNGSLSSYNSAASIMVRYPSKAPFHARLRFTASGGILGFGLWVVDNKIVKPGFVIPAAPPGLIQGKIGSQSSPFTATWEVNPTTKTVRLL